MRNIGLRNGRSQRASGLRRAGILALALSLAVGAIPWDARAFAENVDGGVFRKRGCGSACS